MTDGTRDEISMDNNVRIRDLERQMNEVTVALTDLKNTCTASQKQTADMHRRFLETSPSGEPPLVDRINRTVAMYERASWMGKFGLWTVMTLGGLAAASNQVMNWLRGTGKG